jgi:hypothetical protein
MNRKKISGLVTKWTGSLSGLFFLLVFSSFFSVWAQEEIDSFAIELMKEAEQKYGLNPELINGEKYHYHFFTASGDPYFEFSQNRISAVENNGKVYDDAAQDALASIVIKGKQYSEQHVRYDIYQQLVILDYMDQHGAPASVVLRNNWVEQFEIEGQTFKKFKDQHGKVRFGQVVFEGTVSCVFFWRKEYSPELQNGQKTYSFSEPIREAVLITDGLSCHFRNRRGFLNCFLTEERAQVKAYIKEEHINIRKAGPDAMRRLMKSINDKRQEQ